MLQFLKTRWELLVALSIFIAIKLPALHYPFYADESWSYAPAVKLMYLHGPSLMPDAIDLFYSRGHPLLFYAAAATWMKIFGTTHIAQHSFSLFVSLLLVISVYEISLRLFDKRTALLTLALLPVQVIFFVQSTMLLPEVMIALFSLLTLYFYAAKRYLLTFLCCSALVLTKESGMAMGLILGVCATAHLAGQKEPFPQRLKSFLSLFSAGIVIGSFYLFQKHVNGWYLFPEHLGLIVFDRDVFWKKARFSLEVLFYQDNRIWLVELLLLLAVITAIRLKDIRYATPLLPGILIYIVIENRLSIIPRPALFILMLLSVAYAVYQLVILSGCKNAVTRRFVYLSILFFIGYLCFSCINFFTARYLICLVVIVLILLAAYFMLYISLLHDYIFYFVLTAILLTGYFGYQNDTGLKDINRGAFDAMEVQENVVRYFEQEHLYDKCIFASFINIQHLQKPYTGFLHTDSVFKNVGYEITNNTEYLIIDNIDSVQQFDYIKTNKDYSLVFKTAKGTAWAEVYKK